MQDSHAQEVNDLKEKQQLELQQTQEISAKKQAAIEALEKGIGQLKIEQQELIAKHSKDKEALVTSAEDAKNAAVQVLVCMMHIDCQDQTVLMKLRP